MIDALKQFYREWLEWVDNGPRKPHKYFHYDEGLCANVYDFALNHPGLANDPFKLEEFLRDQFEEQGLNRHYPFGKRSYKQRYRNGTLARCPHRVAWVRAQLEDTSHETQREEIPA